jgi:putative transposase
VAEFFEYDKTLFRGKYRTKSARLDYWDYSSDGWYFVTICTRNRNEFFGEIRNGIMGLNEIGCTAMEFWKDIPNHFGNVFLDEWIVMPNHIHGIIVINNQTNQRRDEALPRLYTGNHPKMAKISPKPKSLPVIIGSFKSIVTKTANLKYPDMGFSWQPRYYDHIMRNEKELNKIRGYIQYNPAMWERDRNNEMELWM